jgi:uncharacterized membrane protein (UPF0127 family)
LKHGRIIDEDGAVVVPRVSATGNSFERMRGLLGRSALKTGEGMLIKPCNAIHTLGMRYPIDAVFLGKDDRVLRIVRELKPLRTASCLRARGVLELAAGEAERLGLEERALLKVEYGERK